MANGTFGTCRPSDFNIEDAEFLYSYATNRSVIGSDFTNYDITEVLSKTNVDGMYNITLPTSVFNQVGIYTLYIRPKQSTVKIQDIGVLSAYPDVKGIVIESSSIANISESMKQNGELIGCRIEYRKNGEKIPNTFRIVTSNNKCEAVSQNITNTNQKSVRYRFNDNSSLIFLTVTPSTAPTVQPNALPYIGEIGDELIISNTFFDPIVVELELTDIDLEGLSNAILGSQTRSIEDGVITIYDKNNNIYQQLETYEIKDSNSSPVYQVRKKLNTIDTTKALDNIENLTE